MKGKNPKKRMKKGIKKRMKNNPCSSCILPRTTYEVDNELEMWQSLLPLSKIIVCIC